jgi:nitrous oxide reductase accessory protein NosL
MRALILVAGAALAVAACSSNDNANNTMNVDENLTTTDMNAVDMNATDMNAADGNVSMNGDLNVTTSGDVNVTDTNAASTNNAM